MKNIALPIYDDPVERYVIPDDHQEEVAYILSNVDILSVDTETYYNPLLVGAVSRFIDGNPNNCPFCMTMTYDLGNGELKSIYVSEEYIPLYKPVLEAENIAKIGHNVIGYDGHMFRNIGLDLKGPIWDTMIMIHLIDEEHVCQTPGGGYKQSKKLKDLAYHYLGDDGHKYEDLVDEVRRVLALRRGIAKSKISYKEVEEACPLIMKDYACSDTEFCYLLFPRFHDELVRQELLIAYEVDFHASLAVLNTERYGIKVDIPYFEKLDAELKEQMQVCTSLITKLIPKELNIRSASDLVQGFKELGLEWQWFTDKNELSTDDGVLRGIIRMGTTGQALLASLVLSYREADKLSGTFVAQMFQYVQADGRVHPDFNVCPNDFAKGGTRTGRLSSSNPNFQNIPDGDKRIERGIVPEEGYVLVSFDYSAQEYRLLGHYSQDRNFMQAIRDGKDIHAATAQLMYGFTYEEAMKKPNRQMGKTGNFATVYQIGKAAMAAKLHQKIDDKRYNAASFLIRGWGYVPWDMPSKDVLLSRCEDAKQEELIEYYFSDEAAAAIKFAEDFKAKYFAQYPQIQKFLKECISTVKRRGWVKTWTGRRRHFKHPKEEGYKGPNALIQGGWKLPCPLKIPKEIWKAEKLIRVKGYV